MEPVFRLHEKNQEDYSHILNKAALELSEVTDQKSRKSLSFMGMS